jgi:hypothetical protein
LVIAPWREVAGHAVVQHELDGVGAAGGLGRLGGLGADHQVLDLEAGGVGVGDVVGHDVELAAKRHLARKADVERVVHDELTRAAGATNAPQSYQQPSCQLENVSKINE